MSATTLNAAEAASPTFPPFNPPDATPAPGTAREGSESADAAVTLSTDELRAAVKALRSVAARNLGEGPPLSGIRIQVEEEIATLGATDLRTAHDIELAADQATPGVLLVPAGLFADILAGVRQPSVALTGTPDSVVIEYGNATFTLYELAKRDYPTLPTPSRSTALALPDEILLQVAESVASTASRDETRPALTQVMFSAAGNVLHAMSTDSYRATIVAFPLEQPVDPPVELLVPVTLLERAAAAVSRGGTQARFSDTEHHVAISLGSERIVAKRAVGAFPDLPKIIADREQLPDTATASVSVEALHAVIRRAGTIISNRTGFPVRFAFTRGALRVRAYDEVGSFEETIAIDYDGADIEIGLAPAYVEEALRSAALSDPDVTIRVAGPTNPVLFISPDAQQLIAPIRLSEHPIGVSDTPPASEESAPTTEVAEHAPSTSEAAGPTQPGVVEATDGASVRDESSEPQAGPREEAELPQLPEPVMDRENRTITADFEVTRLADEKRRVVELRVSHHGAPHRCFTAALRRVEVMDGPTASVRAYGTITTRPLTICHEPVGRFSEKGLQSFLRRALSELERRYPEPEVLAMFTAIADDEPWLP